ncbi:HP1 family phage holin [Arsenophonus endosymbiont of Bemisia tabaci]|uniref:HP1 family phage holin n=1 Tax=Arsenophonus endosymbiont of Bemisia tabaci TaxID=536059 RepID=UPI0030B84F24
MTEIIKTRKFNKHSRLTTSKPHRKKLHDGKIFQPLVVSSYLWAGATTVIGILTLEQWVEVIGIICTIGTFLVNVYYRRR